MSDPIPGGPVYDMGDFIIMPRQCQCGQTHQELLATHQVRKIRIESADGDE